MKREITLKKNREFRYVFQKGRSIAARHLVMVFVVRKTPGLKVGFSVSRKVGNSVVRNRIKRRLKEAFRRMIHEIRPNTLLVFVARPSIAAAEFDEIKKAMQYLLKKAGILDHGEMNG